LAYFLSEILSSLIRSGTGFIVPGDNGTGITRIVCGGLAKASLPIKASRQR
jgi:hypothetical protein